VRAPKSGGRQLSKKEQKALAAKQAREAAAAGRKRKRGRRGRDDFDGSDESFEVGGGLFGAILFVFGAVGARASIKVLWWIGRGQAHKMWSLVVRSGVPLLCNAVPYCNEWHAVHEW
jgi:hypothetical protein